MGGRDCVPWSNAIRFSETVDRRQDTEREGSFLPGMEQHCIERIRALENKVCGRQGPRTDKASMDQRQGKPNGFPDEGGTQIIPQHSEQNDVIISGHGKEDVGLDGSEPAICEDLTHRRPSRAEPILKPGRLGREMFAISLSNRPQFAKTIAGLRGQGDLRIRVGRLDRCLTPLPERRKVKPPGLSVLDEGKVVQRVLS